MTKRTLIIIGFVAALVVTVIVTISFRPDMPSSWRTLTAGMTRDQVVSAVGDIIDMRDLKGFDMVFYDSQMLGSSARWQLLIWYDRSERVTSAEAQFIHPSCGLLNTKPRKLL